MTEPAAAPGASWGAALGPRVIARDCALVVALGVALAVGSNLARPIPLAWIQRTPYESVGQCPLAAEAPVEIPADSPLVRDGNSLIVDLRSPGAYASWHVEGARSQPTARGGSMDDVQRVAREAERLGATRVIVYGEGGDQDTAKKWARAAANANVRNVCIVRGGAPALQGATATETPLESQTP